MDLNTWISWLAMENMQDEFPYYWLGEYDGPTHKLLYFPDEVIISFCDICQAKRGM